MEEERDEEIIDTEEKGNGIIDDVGYVAKKTGLGVASGVAGIGQSVLTESANEMEKGTNMEGTKSKFVTQAFTNSNGIAPNLGTAIVKAPGRIKRAFNILRDKNKKFPDKMVEIFLNASTDVINDMPAKQTYDAAMNMIGNMNPEAGDNVMTVNQLISEPLQNMQKDLNQEATNYGSVTQTMGNVGQVVGNMVPSITAAAVTKNPQISLAAMGISTKGQSTMEALQKGADLNEAVKIGNGKAMVEIGTEMLFGGVNIFGKGAADDIIERGIIENVKNDVARKMAKKGADISGEVLEETISDIIGTMIDKGTVDPNANYTLSDWKDTAITTVLSTVVLNALTRGIGGKVDIAKNENVIENNTNDLLYRGEPVKPEVAIYDGKPVKINTLEYNNNQTLNSEEHGFANSERSNSMDIETSSIGKVGFWSKIKSIFQRNNKTLALPEAKTLEKNNAEIQSEAFDYSDFEPRIINLEQKNINQDLSLDKVIELVKVRENNIGVAPDVVQAINDMLLGNKLEQKAMEIMQYDKRADKKSATLSNNEISQIQEAILKNPKLQEQLYKRRMTESKYSPIDSYMSVYVQMLNNITMGKYDINKYNSIEDMLQNKNPNSEYRNNNYVREAVLENENSNLMENENSNSMDMEISDFESSGFWNKIKSFFQRGNNKPLALPEAKTIEHNNSQSQVENLQNNKSQSNETNVNQQSVKVGNNGRQINVNNLLKTLNSNLTIDNVVELLKVSREANNPNVTKAINEKLKGSKLLPIASQIMKFDNMANNTYNRMDAKTISILQKEIIANPKLQEVLNMRRLQSNTMIDPYMAVYVQILENINQNKYFQNGMEQGNNRGSQSQVMTLEKRTTNGQKTNASTLERRTTNGQRPSASTLEKRTSNQQQPQVSTLEKRNQFKRELAQKAQAKNPGWYNFNTVEGAIQQYISSYIQGAKKGFIDSRPHYQALIEIAGEQQKGQSNIKQQEAMINQLTKKKYIIQEQKNGNGETTFFHIRNNEYLKNKMTEDIRLYLNPKRANAVLLANEIIKKMGNNPIYLKLQADQQMDIIGRSEKIVIFTNKQLGKNGVTNVNQVISAINQIKKEKPNLFKGCENVNPFLKKIEGVAAIAQHPKNSVYIKSDGKTLQIPPSYNSLLAEALNESVEMATNELTNGVESYQNITLDKKLESLLQADPAKLATTVKKYLQQCQNRNSDLDIKGLLKPKQNQIGR